MPTQAEIEAKKMENDRRIAELKAKTDKEVNTGKNVTSLVKSLIPGASFKLNDLSWYTRGLTDPTVNMDLSTFQHGNVADGNLLAVIGTKYSKFNRIYAANSGVYAIEYVPVVGTQNVVVADSQSFSLTVDSAVNDAITRLKSQLDKRNSRIANYANDIIGRYIFAVVDGIHVPMQLLKIALAVYDSKCAEYPDRALQFIDALGFDPEDFQSNLPDYKAFYAEWAPQFNESLPVIKDMSFIDRRLFMAGKFMADSDKPLAQTLVLHPSFIAYANNTDDVIRYFAMNHIRFFSFRSYLLNTYRALSKGASWRPFIRDLRGGVAEENFLKMDTSYKEYVHPIEVTDEVLGQLHNMTTLPQFLDLGQEFFAYESHQALLSRSLSLRGDNKENMIQGLHASDIQATGSPEALNGLIGQGFVAWYGTKDNLDEAKYIAFCDTVKEILDIYGRDHIINRYVTNIPGQTMIDTRLRTTWDVIKAGNTACSIKDDSDYTGVGAENIVVGKGFAIVPKVVGTELVAFIRRVATVEEDYELRNATGHFIKVDMHWSNGYMPVLYSNYDFIDPTGGFLPEMIAMGIGTSITIGKVLAYGAATYRICRSSMSHLDWLPLHYQSITNVSSGSTIRESSVVNGELCMYYTIDSKVLNRLHYQAALSEYSIDGVAILKPLQ